MQRIFNADDARRLARRRVPRMMFDFVDGAAGSETGERFNRAALERIRLQPRVLVNVENRSLEKRIMGLQMGLPLGVAPMGMCNLTWPGADKMLATEAAKRGFPVGVSTASSTTLEEMQEFANGNAWFQLYVGQSIEAGMDMVGRAAKSGYEVLILTVDTPQVSRRIRDQRNGFQVPFRIGVRQFMDFASHPRWSLATLAAGAPTTRNYEISGREFVRSESRGRVDWEFLSTLRDTWQGRLVVKGVMWPEDAARIRDAGADAVYVSNHGGRQLDSAPPAIEALPAIRAAVGPKYPLLFDSGLRSGEDVIRALAAGADFAMMGRPFLYSIGADGSRGLATFLDLVADDIDKAMAQLGLRSVEDIDEEILAGPWEEVIGKPGNRSTIQRVA